MKTLIIFLSILSAHFALTAFAPAEAGKSWFLWPFASDSKPLLNFIGGLPQQSGSIVTPFLAGIAGLCFIAAVLSIFGVWVPSHWFMWLIVVGSVLSVLLFVIYFGAWSVLPIIIDIALIWLVFSYGPNFIKE